MALRDGICAADRAIVYGKYRRSQYLSICSGRRRKDYDSATNAVEHTPGLSHTGQEVWEMVDS
jgi:hypothetical protein